MEKLKIDPINLYNILLSQYYFWMYNESLLCLVEKRIANRPYVDEVQKRRVSLVGISLMHTGDSAHTKFL